MQISTKTRVKSTRSSRFISVVASKHLLNDRDMMSSIFSMCCLSWDAPVLYTINVRYRTDGIRTSDIGHIRMNLRYFWSEMYWCKRGPIFLPPLLERSIIFLWSAESTVPFQSIRQPPLRVTHLPKFWFRHFVQVTVTSPKKFGRWPPEAQKIRVYGVALPKYLALCQNDRYLYYISALWEAPLRVTAELIEMAQ